VIESKNATAPMNGPFEDAKTYRFRIKMERHGLTSTFVNSWLSQYVKLRNGNRGHIAEDELEPVTELRSLNSLPGGESKLFSETVVMKLNGDLCTRLGVERAKGLLELRPGTTLLDLAVQQVLNVQQHHPSLRFMLLNSFVTDADTKAVMKKRYPTLYEAWESDVRLMQNKAPKVSESLEPAEWPERPGAEWCVPGHGDLFASMARSGTLDCLISEGYKYMFVSNVDNLGATLDVRILGHLARRGITMLMEVCERSADDVDEGHIARCKASGMFKLRESSQCSSEDRSTFHDVRRHRFFNTNNIWINLVRLRSAMDVHGGFLPMPSIIKRRPVDVWSKKNPGPMVSHIETSLGTAISQFNDGDVISVPRSRYFPVKTCSDLFGLRSDAYELGEDLVPTAVAGSVRPIVLLDGTYTTLPTMEAAVPHGVPSLRECRSLTVRGKVRFSVGATCKGDVVISNSDPDSRPLVGGFIEGTVDAKTAQPPIELRIQVEKTEANSVVGLEITRLVDRAVLRVNAVREGLVADWNAAHPEAQVRGGDFIVEVNGIRGNADDMVSATKVVGPIEFQVQSSGL